MGEAPVGVVTSNPVVGKADKTSSSDLSWGERARADLRTAMDAKKPGAFDEMVKKLESDAPVGARLPQRPAPQAPASIGSTFSASFGKPGRRG